MISNPLDKVMRELMKYLKVKETHLIRPSSTFTVSTPFLPASRVPNRTTFSGTKASPCKIYSIKQEIRTKCTFKKIIERDITFPISPTTDISCSFLLPSANIQRSSIPRVPLSNSTITYALSIISGTWINVFVCKSIHSYIQTFWCFTQN